MSVFFCYDVLNSCSFQCQGRAGQTNRVAHACVAACYPVTSPNIFTSQRTIQPCPVGLRVWRSSFGNAGYSQRMGCLHSAQTSSVWLIIQIAAANVCFSISPTLWVRNPSYRSSLSRTAISVTFIPSIIVNWILLNSIGVWQSFNTAQHQEQAHLRTWKGL